jgi:ankyrin repeat protein
MTAQWLISHPRVASPLRRAAYLELWDVCHVLVDSQCFDSSNFDHSCALHRAAAAGKAGLVEKLLEQGAWVEQLWSQAEVELELECGCCYTHLPSDQCPYGLALHTLQGKEHPLVAAAACNQSVVCSLLLKQSIHPKIARRAVYWAAAKGHLAALQVLVQEGPTGTSQPGVGMNPMFGAARRGHKHVVELFLALGADLYNAPGTPWSGGACYASCLHEAVSGVGDLELVQLLLQHEGMSLERDWQQVLESAARRGDLRLVRLLIDCAHAVSSEQPLQQPQHQSQQLIKRHTPGSNSTMPGWAQLWCALPMAAGAGHMGVVLLLLHCGMDVTQQALQSALTRAAGSGRLEVVQLLLQYGADINDGASDFSSEGPLGVALKGKHWAVAEALMMRGAHASFDALMHALQCRALSRVVQLLLQRGIRDRAGRAMFRASQAGQQDTVELLLNNNRPSTFNRRVMAIRLEAAVCGAAAQAHLQLLQFLLAPPTRFLPGRADAMGSHIISQVLNKGLEAAVQGRHYKWGNPAQDYSYGHLVERSNQDRLAVVVYLLQHGADPNYQEGQLLRTAVQQLMWHEGAVLQELLRAGGNKIDLALELAAGSGHASIVSLLLSATKGPVDSTGAALLSAASAGHSDIAAMLLQRDANATAAVHAAVASNNLTATYTILFCPAATTHTVRTLQQVVLTLALESGLARLLQALGQASLQLNPA